MVNDHFLAFDLFERKYDVFFIDTGVIKCFKKTSFPTKNDHQFEA